MVKRKRIGKYGLYVLLALLLLIAGQTLYHQVMVRVEAPRLQPVGELVEVNGHTMHVHAEGESSVGEPTLVFLSGSGTAAPVYDFQTLFTRFATDYRVAVVERSGYGYSETSGESRDLDTVLAETRVALAQAGEKGPYVLIPHSLSGIESLYWAQQYPAEVMGIIGLDMSVPEAAENISIPAYANLLMMAARFIGFQRIPFLYPVEYVELSTEQKEQARYLNNRNAFNVDVRNEMGLISENFGKVDYGKLPDIPILLFTSNDSQSRKELEGFAEVVESELVYLDVGHYLHQFAGEQIYEEGKRFVEQLE